MRRYSYYRSLNTLVDSGGCQHCDMVEDKNGKYVLYEDHLREIARFEKAILKMVKRIEIIKAILKGGEQWKG